ncbi:hypothetical protein LY76DRAFT_596979 [Colletotrichum caudatum]|nr:hypothetical protein LY76DRAFT_596979 [Colletotrichum caudatum]
MALYHVFSASWWNPFAAALHLGVISHFVPSQLVFVITQQTRRLRRTHPSCDNSAG